MFNKSNNTSIRNNLPDSGTVNIIGAGTTIDGDIISSGDIRIDGSLKGTVKTRGKLVVGPSGIVEGEVNCQHADISGTIRGKVNVAELLSLKATAKLSGEITTGKLAIEPGADFSGSCSMGGVVKEIQHEHNDTGLAEKTA
ncbi:MAG: polymer-forming cytoskeletal protein [Bacteroidia bacterium]